MMKNMSKIDWPGVFFAIMLCIAVPTCYYQQGETARHKASLEAQKNSCSCNTENTDTENEVLIIDPILP